MARLELPPYFTDAEIDRATMNWLKSRPEQIPRGIGQIEGVFFTLNKDRDGRISRPEEDRIVVFEKSPNTVINSLRLAARAIRILRP
jgi:hypothetical protein